MLYPVALLLLLAAATGNGARGLGAENLAALGRPIAQALGAACIVRTEPARLLATCPDDANAPIVSLQWSRQPDGTEGRVRSGATSMADVERICRARSPDCTLSALDIPPAIGWVTAYAIGPGAGATAVILRDGEMLTIRSIAPDAAAARKGIDTLLPIVRAHIPGY